MDNNGFLIKAKAFSLIIAHAVILYASLRMSYVNFLELKNNIFNIYMLLGLIISLSVSIVFILSLFFSMNNFPYIRKVENLSSDEIGVVERTKIAFISIVGIIYFSVGILGLLLQMYFLLTFIALFVIFTPFVLEKMLFQYNKFKGAKI